ncbi:MAG: ATP-grasp domain-containing protein [Candidatus Muirbacterium halophilum]|nr:ATP-grasp domain-containing protein [Candidatus Muirbacterium halophilum]MCK9476006.1 ATP-grasp domain-containing protein [Candidatus Muirbacterium halophilum]
MFKKMLIANRGNIAVNIIRACKELGIETIAIYSDVDKESMHVRYADKAYYIGEAKYKDDYRNFSKVIEIALKEKVDVIHPGFGFLAQNIEFLKECKKLNIKVISDEWEKVEKFSDKIWMKEQAEKLGIPIVNGFEIKKEKDLEKLRKPLVIKPVNGWAGRGIQYVDSKDDIFKKLEIAKKESKTIFNTNRLLAEEYIDNSYLIEVTVVGNAKEYVSLPTTDSSLRRKFQKIVSEAPAEYIDISIRKKIVEYAKKLSEKISLNSMANFEFIVQKKNIYFLELNPRLPVNYAVVEMLTGFNLIKQQISLAYDNIIQVEEIPLENIKGNAFECRLYAEDYFNKFEPCSGNIKQLIMPGGKDVRVEFDYFSGDEVTSYYDSQIGRLLVKSLYRKEMVNKIRWAVAQTKISGISTTLPFIENVVNTKLFNEGKIVSDFITHVMRERRFKKARQKEFVAAIVAALSYHNENEKKTIAPRINLSKKDASPWNILGRSKIIKKWGE